MSWQRSGELLIMVILGGVGTLYGAIIGAAAYLLLEEWLSGFTEHWKVIFGPLLVIVVLFARGGLIGVAAAAVEARAVADAESLRIDDLRKKFRRLAVTDDVTLDVAPGELHAVIGPNGAGKTTLINQISGLLRAATPAASCFAGATSPRCRRTRARGSAWRARSRSPRSCRASRRWRTSRSRCRRASGSSFRFFGRAAREAALNEPALRRARRGRARRPRRRAGGRALARREARARARDRARDGSRSCCCSTSRWPASAARRPSGWSALLARLKGRFADDPGRARHGRRCSRSPTASRC